MALTGLLALLATAALAFWYVDEPAISIRDVVAMGFAWGAVAIATFAFVTARRSLLLRDTRDSVLQGSDFRTIVDVEIADAPRQRDTAEDDLDNAIRAQALTLFYQPVVAAHSGKMIGVEALVRWPHPTRGLVSPDEFIAMAEESGLILPLGEWVLRQACIAARRWPSLRIAVNVSPVQFRQPDFVATVMRILNETKLEPNRLELELTEGVLIDDADMAESAIIDLRAMGIRMAMDDFGTGYSSLIYLRRFAFDKIKIDKGFLQALEPTGESAIIIESIVKLGLALGLTVNAEGIETLEHAQFMQKLGCNELQGFFYAPPVSAEEIDAKLTEADWRMDAEPAPAERSVA